MRRVSARNGQNFLVGEIVSNRKVAAIVGENAAALASDPAARKSSFPRNIPFLAESNRGRCDLQVPS